MKRRYSPRPYSSIVRNLSHEIDSLDEECRELYYTQNIIVDSLTYIQHHREECLTSSYTTFNSVEHWLADLLQLVIPQSDVVCSYGPRLLPPSSIARRRQLNDWDNLKELLRYGMSDEYYQILCDLETPDDLDAPEAMDYGLTIGERDWLINCHIVLNDKTTSDLFIQGYLAADTPQAIEQVFRRQCKQRQEDKGASDSSLLDMQSRFSTLKEAMDYINSQYTCDDIVKDYIHSFEKDIPRLVRRWRQEGKYHESDLPALYDYLNLRDQVILHYDPQLYYQQHPEEASPQGGAPTTPPTEEAQEALTFRQRHLDFFQAAEQAGLIGWQDDHYETPLGAVELDYLLGRYFCHDTTRTDAQGRQVWVRGDVARGRLPRLELNALFPHFRKLGDHRNEHTRVNSPKNSIPSNIEVVNRIDAVIEQLATDGTV